MLPFLQSSHIVARFDYNFVTLTNVLYLLIKIDLSKHLSDCPENGNQLFTK